ncbi:MAG: hypothetical protein ACYDHP_08750 [Ferrimicrobium sp.]
MSRRRADTMLRIKSLSLVMCAGTLLLAGCGSTRTATNVSSPVGNGYVAAGGNFVALFELTDNNGKLSGVLRYVSENGSPPSIQSRSVDVSGTVSSGNVVELDLGNSLFGSHRVLGTLSNFALALNIPTPGGSLQLTTFKDEPLSTFNKDVATVAKNVNVADQQAAQAAAAAQAQANQEAAAAQAQAQIAAQAQANQSAVVSAASTVSSDIASLQGDISTVQSDTQQVGTDLATEGSDLTKAQTRLQTMQQLAANHPNGDSGEVCYNASEVSYDQSVVTYGAGVVEYDLGSLEGDLQQLAKDLSTLQSDSSTLNADLSATPGFTPNGGIPSATSVEQTANSENAQAISVANAAVTTANNEQTTAYQYTQTAGSIQSCGGGASSPTPITFPPSNN